MSTKFFGTVRPNIFAGKRDTLYYTWNLWKPQLFWIFGRMRKKFFGTVRQKIFNWNLWYPLLCIKFPVTPNYLKHWRDAHKIFRHCETKNFCRKDVIHPVMYKTFRYSKFLKHWRDAHKFFRHCENKISRLKNVIPFTIHETFRYPKIFEILNGWPPNFSALWDKKNRQKAKKRDTPCYAWNFLIPHFFGKIGGMPTKFFGSLRPKFFAEKTWYPLLYMKIFDTPTFLKHWTDAHKNFRHKETKIFRRKNVLLLLCIKIFDTLIFLKPWRNVHKIFQLCETEIFRRNFVIPPIIHKLIRYLKLSETLKGCPKKFFGTMRSKFFAGKCDTLYYTWNFSIPQVCGNIERKRTKIFGTVRQKVFNWKMWDPLLCIKFLIPQIIWNIKRMPMKFSALWDKNISRVKRDNS